jgi:hypothetical protein
MRVITPPPPQIHKLGDLSQGVSCHLFIMRVNMTLTKGIPPRSTRVFHTRRVRILQTDVN